MYRKSSKGWLKHWDFILLDIVCLQMAFLAAYFIRHGVKNPYVNPIYRNEAVIMVLICCLITFVDESFKNVLKRGIYREFVATVKQVVLVSLSSAFYLFMVQEGEAYSRMTLLLTGVFYLCLSYPARLIRKRWLVTKVVTSKDSKALLIMTSKDRLPEIAESVKREKNSDYRIVGAVIADAPMAGTKIAGIDVVADMESVTDYVCRQWVDAVFVDCGEIESKSLTALEEVLAAFHEMGITTHVHLNRLYLSEGKKQRVEKLGEYMVLTSSVNIVSAKLLFYKRVLDIIGGAVGCLIMAVLFLAVAPVIYIKSPGPVFFSQVRVGRNGKKFKMYKFRSMYLDAEDRKKELMDANQMEGGLMFKMQDDPRIIKGIGHFIRKYSIDEFPQFYNVLKGDMSLVGTRPPTVDEWERYAPHHRVRLAAKPGITGLWQVSGRSDITDFEEVVQLDAKYIREWNIGLDVKILLQTIGIVVGSVGAM